MRSLHLFGLLSLAFTAASALAQIPAFTIVNTGLDATFGNTGKGIFDPQVAGLSGIAYGNGLFVVIGQSSNDDTLRWATSPDGTTWTARTQALAGGAKTFTQSKVHFLNGKFLFFAEHSLANNAGSTAVAYTSADGLTWTASNSISSGRLIIGEFDASPTLTVAAGNNGAQYASTDLVTWTARPVVPNGAGYDHNDITYGGGRFISTTNGFGGQTYSSADAAAWTALAGLTTPGGGRVEAGNGVIILNLGNNRYRSADGVTFTQFTPTMNPTTYIAPGGTVRFTGGRFLATAIDLATGRENYMASTDGQAWTQFASFPTAPSVPAGQSRVYLHLDIAFGAGKYVIAANDIQQTLTTKATLPVIMTLDAPAAPTPPTIATQPAAANVVAGGTATFTVAASGTGNTYQWRKDGTNIAGATGATLTISNVTAANVGSYTVVVTNSVGSVTSTAVPLAIVTASNVGRLINMSIRTNAGTGDSTLIVGVTLGGAGARGTKAVLVRGVGPTLSSSFGVAGALADPVMTVTSNNVQVAQNDDWPGGFDFASVGAFAFAGATPRDAGIYSPTTEMGGYSIQITGKNNATGIALAEIYDATPSGSFSATTPRLTNVSARTQVGTGDNILIAGFVIGGSSPVRVLIRAVGPTLTTFGVGGTLADPKLEVKSNAGATVAENDNWLAADAPTFASVGAFGLNANSRDAAVVTTLQPGSYTAQVSGVNNTTGIALVEVYELP